MPFPNSPSNGQLATINNIVYAYNSTKGAWNKANIVTAFTSTNVSMANLTISSNAISFSKTTGALIVVGGAGIGGNLTANSAYVTNGVFWSANSAAYADPAGTAVALAIALG